MFRPSLSPVQTLVDTLQAHVAVLDEHGTIVLVNEAWRRFGAQNDLKTADACLGVNYLTVCAQTTGADKESAAAVAAAIHNLWAGIPQSHDIEYTCHSPQEQRWFSVRITLLPIDGQQFVLLTHESITRRKNAEVAFQEEHNWLELAHESISMGTWRHDFATGEIKLDARGREHYGFSTTTITLADLLHRIHPDDLARVEADLADVLAPTGTGRYISEHRVIHPDGSIHWLAITAHFYFAGEGLTRQPRLGVGTSLDITAHKEAEIALRESESRYRLLAENMTDVIWVLDINENRFTYISPSIQQLRGYTVAQALAEKMENALTPPSWHSLQTALPERLNRFYQGENIAYTDELEQYHQDGTVVNVEIISRFVVNPDNGHLAVHGLSRNITKRKQAEAQLRYQATLLQTVSDAIIATDENFVITHWNAAATTLYGWTAEETVGQLTFTIFHTEYETDTREQALAEITAQGFWRGIVRQKRKDGTTLFIMSSVVAIKDEAGQWVGMVAANRDISELVATEKRLEETLLELRRSNQELEQFAYVASHDLQEPLRAVAGMVQLLRQRYARQLDERADEYITHAVDAAARMQTLINDLLSFSRVGTKGQPFTLTASDKCLEQALSNLRVAIAESGAIITSDPLPNIMADAGQITQLWQNLIANALKFRRENTPHIHLTAQADGQEIHFAVQDNGIGIAPEYHERIFVIFQRLHSRREYPGTGIGLALCKKIVERHRGRIWVTSQPGEGSTFHFTLPQP